MEFGALSTLRKHLVLNCIMDPKDHISNGVNKFLVKKRGKEKEIRSLTVSPADVLMYFISIDWT